MAYGGLSKMWWRSSPDLAMPNSARHRRDARRTTTRRRTKSHKDEAQEHESTYEEKWLGRRDADKYSFDHDWKKQNA